MKNSHSRMTRGRANKAGGEPEHPAAGLKEGIRQNSDQSGEEKAGVWNQ